MDPLVTIALVGTARQEYVNPVTGTPVDELVARLAAEEDERKLLLSAGTLAIYRQAGQKAQQIATVLDPAAPEKLRSCSPAAALLLSRLLNGEQADLLPGALARLHEVGMHLPYHLLPLALNKSGKELHAAIFPVLGERGLWVSGFNPAWNWVRDFLPGDEKGLPADAETIWQEGTAAQRVEILRRLRAVDPQKARTWLEGVWKQEKAEVRGDLLAVLETGLGADDEAFLEKALDDRATSVRFIASSLLVHLPTSALIERMCTRGKEMLKFVKGKLTIKPPAEFDKTWLRDGIQENPPNRVGKRTWWLIQVLASIPPSFWETYLEADAASLVATMEKLGEEKWGRTVIEGWSKATVSYHSPAWVQPLWGWWCKHYGEVESKDLTDYTIRQKLLQVMPRQEAEDAVLALLNAKKDEDWPAFLPELPRPWSDAFARVILHRLRTNCLHPRSDIQKFNPYADPWFSCLSDAALALPASCLSEASQPWDLSVKEEKEESSWQVNYARQLLHNFVETVQMRQKIYKEIF